MLPVILDLSFIKIYSYPLFLGLAWGIAYQIAYRTFGKNYSKLKFELFFWGLFAVTWLGAKIFYLINSSGEYLNEYVSSSNFWLGGGFVFYGGVILGIAFVFLATSFFKLISKHERYKMIVPLVIGHAVGRVGCFMAGCCYGSECHLPWAVTMHEKARHPVQLYEAFLLLGLGWLLYQFQKREQKDYVISLYFLSYAVIRFILEFYRGDTIRGTYLGHLSSSQVISGAIFLTTVVIILYRRLFKDK